MPSAEEVDNEHSVTMDGNSVHSHATSLTPIVGRCCGAPFHVIVFVMLCFTLSSKVTFD